MTMINERLAIEKGLITGSNKLKYSELVKNYKYLTKYVIICKTGAIELIK